LQVKIEEQKRDPRRVKYFKTQQYQTVRNGIQFPLSPQKLNATKFGSIFCLKKILWKNRGNLIFIFEK
jgi:hypothetical protein